MIDAVGKIVSDGVLTNFCETCFESKKNSLKRAMQEVVRMDTALIVNQKTFWPILQTALSGKLIVAVANTL